MAPITIQLSDAALETLEKMAQEFGIAPEQLLCASIENWLAHSSPEFIQASRYVLHKNADLYQRLA